MTESYSVQTMLPVGWPADEPSRFLDMARSNVIASFVRLPAEYEKCRQIDDALLLICANLSNAGDWFAPLFALKSHSCYRAAAGSALAGASPEAFMVMRGAIESARYGYYIHVNKRALEVWMKCNESDAAKKTMKSEFTVANMWKCLGAQDSQLCARVQGLYEKNIELGGHPNPASVAMSIKMSQNPEGARFKLNHLSADTGAISETMKSIAQTGIALLLIFRHVFSRPRWRASAPPARDRKHAMKD